MTKRKLLSGAMMVIIVFILILGVNQFRSDSQVYAARGDKFGELENFSQALDMVKKRYVDEVEDQEIMEGAIKGMLRELDPHSAYYTPEEYKAFMVDMEGSFGGLGMTIGMRNNMVTVIAPIEDTPAYKAGIMAGDTIYKIDNVTTVDMDTEGAVKLMRGKPGTSVTLTIIRSGEAEPLVFNMVRDIIKVKSVKSDMLAGNIAYVRLTNFQNDSGKEVEAALSDLNKQGSVGIIFDLRLNPGGSLEEAIYVSSLFLPTGKVVVSTKGRTEDSSLSTRNMSFREVKKPLVVLVDEGSASASEIVAGAVQDHERGIVLGTTTFGKASVQTIYELGGGDGGAMKLTTARYYTPNGRSIQGVGIVPDVEVPRGKIVYSDNSFMLKESDLAGHLVGEDEGKQQATESAGQEDLQLQSAIQLIKGLALYGGN